MSVNNIFGPIVTGKMVRTAMRKHLQLWMPTYLAEVARDDGRKPLPVFRSWVSSLDMPDGRFAEDQIPCCVIVAPGLVDDPVKMKSGYIVRWGVSVGAVIAGQDRENTFDLSELYAAAIRAAVLHKPSLGGFSNGTDWLGERYDDIPNAMQRTLGAGTVQFSVEVQTALLPRGGPAEPLLDVNTDPGPEAMFTAAEATTVQGV